MPSLTYATRRSALALAQSRAFVAHLRSIAASLETDELQVVTSGDRVQDRPLTQIGGKGLFVKEIEEALLERRADFAVHSMKDVPSTIAPGLIIACIPTREDACDVLVAPRHRSLEALPPGARVGTSSLRRLVAIRALRPDLVIASMRGNVDTRLRKVDAGEWDAIVLARAGLVRLGLQDRATQVLPTDALLPAAGQGALAIECRRDDAATRALLWRANDEETAKCVTSERAALLAVEGDCKTPFGAHAERVGGSLRLRAFIAHPDGTGLRRAERAMAWPVTEAEAEELGRLLGEGLIAQKHTGNAAT
jgi:hydroxymethylbilane synthase